MTGLGRDPFDDLIAPPAPSERPSAAHANPSPRSASATARRTFDLPRELVERLRDAAWALSGPPHRLTLNQLAASALARELDRLQHEHNHGEPFPPRGGELRPGRRLEP